MIMFGSTEDDYQHMKPESLSLRTHEKLQQEDER